MKYLLLFLFLGLHSADGQNGVSVQQQLFKVKKVVDGDTFWVDDGTERGIKIRLIGVDAPEPRNVFKKKKEPFGKEASLYLKQMIEGKQVRLGYDVGRLDRYNRTLAYAWLEDGTFINARLIEDGYAVVMTVPPNVKYANYFVKLQQKARKKKRGLWGKNS